jgi:hypothetical protein
MGGRIVISSKFGVSHLFVAAAFTHIASEGWWARQDSNLQPDRYERQNIDQIR